MSATEELSALRACVRPVMFETGIPGYPYATAGSAFLLAYQARVFVLTAKHVVSDYPVERLLVFPSEQSRTPLRISDYYRIDAGNSGEDVEDFLVIETDVGSLTPEERKSRHLIHLTPSADAWHEWKFTAQFFLIGYPSPKSHVDYERSVIHTGQVLMVGRYVTPFASPLCHELLVEDPHSLSTFSGLSGCPVFSLSERLALPSDLTLCGMALRGTPASKKVYFLESAVLRAALERAVRRRNTRRGVGRVARQ